MWKYGQYCPFAHAMEILSERWTLLIIRDMMQGTKHFNDLERGLPGISRGLLAKRLQLLERVGIVEKRSRQGRQSTEYHLTEAGCALESAVDALSAWGARWAFGDPEPRELNSELLMWWVYRGVNADTLPDERIVVQFTFFGEKRASYWLMLQPQEVNLCLTDPGFETQVLVRADLATFFKVWAGRMDYQEALNENKLRVDGMPRLARAFPNWFRWSAAAPDVRRARANS